MDKNKNKRLNRPTIACKCNWGVCQSIFYKHVTNFPSSLEREINETPNHLSLA